jgi:uncharacterized protein YkwD
LQITTRNSWTSTTLRVWLGFLAVVSLTAGARAQTYYYYPSSGTPVYYRSAGYRGQTVWSGYSNPYYQTAYSTPVYQTTYTPQYYQTAYYDPNVQTAAYSQQTQAAKIEPATLKAEVKPATTQPEVKPATTQPEQAEVPGGDPYGFVNWLNATRAAYGLSAVGYDPNLSGWAAMNNDHQASRGLGHFVMGPARRQNAAMGGFPGIESMWMASPAHRAALLDPTIRWIGIAGLGAYWTFNAN